MVSQYLDSLKDSLILKSSLLSEVTELSYQQKEIVSAENVNWDEFDQLVDKKSELIDKLNNLDDGFETVYSRISSELESDKDKYKDRIINIQNLIKEVTEKSTSLMALEERNKVLVTNSFKKARQKISQNKVSNKVASSYYRAMSKVNYIDPQLMDKKK